MLLSVVCPGLWLRHKHCASTILQVWSLRLDAHVLDYDGNAIDAISLAALAALSHFRFARTVGLFSYENAH